MTGFRACFTLCIFGCLACVEGFQVSTLHLNRLSASRNEWSLVNSFQRAQFAVPAPNKRMLGSAHTASARMVADKDTSGVAVILLAGGVGSRMKADRPKQFLELEGKPILFHSLDLFLTLSGIISITVVIAEEYRDMFKDLKARESRLRFASPGKERQVPT